MATINITLNDENATKIIDADNKDYAIQGFYKMTSSNAIIESPFELFKGEPSEGLQGYKDNYFKVTADVDIYVKALNIPTTLVIGEC